ncbi:hypothetical protein HPB49_025876 [Dermacentor silvarum]|nr:hypothetical protein HPB49_025876 [Dermacentor silvarum]
MAGTVCLVILEDGQRKKICLPSGAYGELLGALRSLTEINDTTLEVQNVQSVPLEKEKDYLDFVLPSFGHYEEVLKRKVPINGAVRRAIVDKLFAACFKIAWYPSRQLYRVAAERLLSSYPHLADRVGTGNGLDCSHLVTYGETAESLKLHNEWLRNNAGCQDEEAVKPRLRATAKDRHEQLRSLTLSDALLLFPFLATEASLLVEFNLLFQRDVMEAMENGCKHLGYTILSFGEAEEIVAFSEVASEKSSQSRARKLKQLHTTAMRETVEWDLQGAPIRDKQCHSRVQQPRRQDTWPPGGTPPPSNPHWNGFCSSCNSRPAALAEVPGMAGASNFSKRGQRNCESGRGGGGGGAVKRPTDVLQS